MKPGDLLKLYSMETRPECEDFREWSGKATVYKAHDESDGIRRVTLMTLWGAMFDVDFEASNMVYGTLAASGYKIQAFTLIGGSDAEVLKHSIYGASHEAG